MRRSAFTRSLLLLGISSAACWACHRHVPAPPPPDPAPVVEAPPASPVVPLERVGSRREGASVALARLGGKPVALVADADSGAVRTIDLDARREVGSIDLLGRPGQILVTRQGKVAVALRDDGAVALLDAHADGSLSFATRHPTAVEPIALALSPDDATLFVASGWGHTLQSFDLATWKETRHLSIAREPRAVLVAPDGKHAFVAHSSVGKLDVIDLAAPDGKLAAVDLGVPSFTRPGSRSLIFDALVPVDNEAGPPIDDPPMPFRCGFARHRFVTVPPRFARQGYALVSFAVPDRKGGASHDVVLAPHTEVMTGDPLAISSGYGGGGIEDFEQGLRAEVFGISTVDGRSGTKTVFTRAGDSATQDGCHLPRGAAVDAAGKRLLVACLGSNALMSFDVSKGKVGRKALARVPVAAGPTGVAVDETGGRAVVFSQFDATLSVVPLATLAAPATKEAPPPAPLFTVKLERPSRLSEKAALGRKLFHSGGDARIAKDGRACASCHPGGRDDGLVWSTPNGPRQTIMLAGREARPAPFGWMGKHGTLQIHMAATMKNLKGTGLPASDADALAAYIQTMKGPPHPVRTLTKEEEHGKDVFESPSTGCSTCHAGSSGFSDHDVHNVHSATIADTQSEFLAPSLIGVGGSAPYFHDGRYATLDDLIAKSDGKMGTTSTLSPMDRRALAAYLATL